MFNKYILSQTSAAFCTYIKKNVAWILDTLLTCIPESWSISTNFLYLGDKHS